MPAGVAPAGSEVGGAGQLGQGAVVDGERADCADPAVVDEQVAAVGAEPCIDRADPAGLADRGAAQQRQRAVRCPATGDASV
jgi:hypothetical protein